MFWELLISKNVEKTETVGIDHAYILLKFSLFFISVKSDMGDRDEYHLNLFSRQLRSCENHYFDEIENFFT